MTNVATVDADPEEDTNPTGTPHAVNARATRTAAAGGGNAQGTTIHFRVVTGPHADNDLDSNPSTPAGYFGSCVTGATGECSRSYTGTEGGTDTIEVWTNAGTETGTGAAFTPDADDVRDPGGVQKTWNAPPPPQPQPEPQRKCPGFENDPRNHVVGTEGDDELAGTEGADIICGLGGRDLINGGGGDDLILGGDGRDAIKGDDGNDTIKGGDDNDTMRGGAGNDGIAGQGGNDVLTGNAGNDLLKGNAKNDTLKGGAGDDVLNGGAGTDICRTGPGNDQVGGCED